MQPLPTVWICMAGIAIRVQNEYKKFMAVNNSVLDTTGKDANDEAGFARTFKVW